MELKSRETAADADLRRWRRNAAIREVMLMIGALAMAASGGAIFAAMSIALGRL